MSTAPQPTATTTQVRPRRLRPGQGKVVATVTVIALLAVAALAGVIRAVGGAHQRGSASSASTTSLYTVTRQTLTAQTSVSATLGYSGSYSVNNQYSPPAAAAKLQHAVDAAQTAYNDAVAQANFTNQVDPNRVAADQSQLSADQKTFSSDGCTSSSINQRCAQDQQAINNDQTRLGQDQVTQKNDQLHGQASVDQAKASLVQAQDNLAAGSGGGGPGGGGGMLLTWLPGVGAVIDRGNALYKVNGTSIPLFFGDETFSRQLTEGVSGHDVQELEENLLALGYASSGNLASDGNFTAADTAAVKRWQQALGVPASGVVNVGDVVVLPGAARVKELKVDIGAGLSAGTQVLTATSTSPMVTIALDAAQQSKVKVGDKVTIALPNGRTTPGTVSLVGTVATTPPSTASAGSSSTPTVEVDVTPSDPAATANLDQAPVTVAITTSSANNVLVVPVTALLGQDSGFAVEEVSAGGRHHLVAVTLGLVDDAHGLVEVSGPGLAAGQQVVVPAQ